MSSTPIRSHDDAHELDSSEAEWATGVFRRAQPSRELTPVDTALPAAADDFGVSMTVVRGLVDAVERAGVARGSFLSAAAFDASTLEDPAQRLSRRRFYGLCQLALGLTQDAALGLHWAQRLSDRTFAPVSPLLAHAANLREGFGLLARFSPLLSERAGYRIYEQDETVVLHALPLQDESAEVQRFAAEMVVAGFWRLVRSFDRTARPEAVTFTFAAPACASEYETFFGTRVSFGQPVSSVVFDRALLATSPALRDDEVREALCAVAERRLVRLGHGVPYALRVREQLLRERRPQRLDMDAVARALGLSERSLRRRLEAEGTTYHELLTDALARLASELLGDPRRTIQDVAYEMGFADPSAFHRAFKRWTGLTPAACRARLLR